MAYPVRRLSGARIAVALFCIFIAIAALASALTGPFTYNSPNCFFSVAKSTAGKWWFVDPNGQPFFSIGAVSVTFTGPTKTGGGFGDYYNVAQQTYGNAATWAVAQKNRLLSWNYNTIGPWSTDEITKLQVPYTVIITFNNAIPPQPVFPDVWNPAWINAVNNLAYYTVFPLRNDPYLIGWYLDNELFWGRSKEGYWDPRWTTLLDYFLHNKQLYSNANAVNFVRSRYGTIAALNAAWGTTYASFETITTPPIAKQDMAAHVRDSNDFAGIVADQYFSVTTGAVRALDPNHLILGTKFSFAPVQSVTAKAGQYCDVISWDYYTNNAYDPRVSDIDSMCQWAGDKPMLIAEYGFRAMDSGLPNSGNIGPKYATQTERAAGWKNYTTLLATSKYMVGFHWFQFHDMPAVGWNGVGSSDSNYGLINKNNDPYTVVVNMHTTVNPTLKTIHEANPTGLVAKCKAALTCHQNCNGHGCCDTATGNCRCNDGWTGLACSEDHATFALATWPATVDATKWKILNGYGSYNQYFLAARTTISGGIVNLAFTKSGCPCGGYTFGTGGLQTANTYGYGVYKAELQFTNSGAVLGVMTLRSTDATTADSITMYIQPNYIAFDSYTNGVRKALDYAAISFNPSTTFYRYEIHYAPDSFKFYANGVLLKTVTAANVAPNALPRKLMQLSFYNVVNTGITTAATATLRVRGVSFTQATSNVATC